MLTVGQALDLEVFAGARCIAGHTGLNRIIRWVHNVGVPDAANWLNGGELVLTTYINMPQGRDEQVEYLRAVIDKGVAALGLAVGRFVDAVPDYLCALADEKGFPLIAVPYQLLFVDIAQTINKAISQRDLRAALDIHQQLTRLVMRDVGLDQLAVTLATLIKQSVSIENERFEAYANHNLAPVDEARRYTQQQGRTDPRLVDALEKRGYLADIRRTMRPVMLPKMPDVGLEMERILAPIVVNGEIFGYVWIIADGSPLSELEQMAVESGSTIAALMLLRQEKTQREEAVERGDLVARLLTSKAAEREDWFADRALRYGLNLRVPYRVLVVDGLRPPLNRAVTRAARLSESFRWAALAGQAAEQLVLIVQDGEPVDVIAATLTQHMNGEFGLPRIAISGPGRGAPWAARALSEGQDALIISTRLNPADRIIFCETLGFLLTLYRAGSDSLYSSSFSEALRELRNEESADLFHTLEVYLDLGGSGVAAAEALHIHRSTLNYRLGRITELTGTDLGDPQQRVNLHTSLKLLRLFE
ncbi:MAG: PucR family transcriptional regulator ligand-binding domain-containing protein [Chloroflexi bacterium]|nr:PucR family transcriptional regulator ligand-binding domain-containing protein [Chloroflexota bacterium]